MTLEQLKTQLQEAMPKLDQKKLHYLATVDGELRLLASYLFPQELEESIQTEMENKYGSEHNLIVIWPHVKKDLIEIEINWGIWSGRLSWKDPVLRAEYLRDRTTPLPPVTEKDKQAFKSAILEHFEKQRR
jgi:hypothetical protein